MQARKRVHDHAPRHSRAFGKKKIDDANRALEGDVPPNVRLRVLEAFDEAGTPDGCHYEAASLQLLPGRTWFPPIGLNLLSFEQGKLSSSGREPLCVVLPEPVQIGQNSVMVEVRLGGL